MFSHAKKFFTESRSGAFALAAAVAVPSACYFRHEKKEQERKENHKKWKEKAAAAFKGNITELKAAMVAEYTERYMTEERLDRETATAKAMNAVNQRFASKS